MDLIRIMNMASKYRVSRLGNGGESFPKDEYMRDPRRLKVSRLQHRRWVLNCILPSSKSNKLLIWCCFKLFRQRLGCMVGR